MRWLRFYRYQSKCEREIAAGVRRYARRLRKRVMHQLKYLTINLNEEFADLWGEIEPVLTNALRYLPTHFKLNVDYQLYEPRVTARLMSHKRRIRYITEATWKQLQKAIAAALERGDDITKAVNEVLVDLETWRAERIARTESMGALNGAYLDAITAAGFTKKMWVAALDERTRHTHAEANGQVRYISEPFQVGKALLQFPADPACPYPEEVINCRCTIVEIE